MSKLHEIKLLSEFADDVYAGRKNFEIRKNDRDYRVGDTVQFRVIGSKEAANHILNTRQYEITYVLSGWGIEDGFVAFGIKPVTRCFSG